MIRIFFWNVYAKLICPHLTVRVHRFDNGDVSVGLYFDEKCRWCLNGLVLRAREKQRVESILVHRATKHPFK